MRWKWVVFGGAVPHACPAHLVDRLIRDLEGRGAREVQVLDVENIALDQPGMICTTRPTEDVVLDGLTVNFPSEDIAAFVDDLASLQERTFYPVMQTGELVLGAPYYKLHGYYRAIVMSPAQRQQLLANLRDILPSAERRAAEFYATRPTPGQALRTANAQALGIPEAELPDVGGHRLDRFIPKGKGQA